MSETRKQFFARLGKEHYTILVPDMCPIQFHILKRVVELSGYRLVVISPEGREAKDVGLSAIHNDACYPVVILAGSFIQELRTGKYDLSKTAVLISQTGGGCRASNYLSLFRKAFEKEFPQVPVLSLNFSGLEKDFSLPFTLKRARMMLAGVCYGDMLMNLVLQSEPYYPKDEVDAALKDCLDMLDQQIGKASFLRRKANYRHIIERFSNLTPPEKRKPLVGIVGEIYVKYSPYANNHLASFLVKEGCEVVYPSLMEFVQYCIYNSIEDHRRYGKNKATIALWQLAYRYTLSICKEAEEALKGTGFRPYEDFRKVVEAGKKVISTGVKMGEGWLIPAEMVEYTSGAVKNIVVVQPFGCLPNHIVGKGMIRPVKALNPDANIVPIDFDASSTSVNQENRLKLMLANLG
ncbi:MAG: 2-hydroxyacyl-CoA dehydratase [Bacilli bacterium]|nr:2-hydroxyacyl-CoA dehydratase [Bacilli bacterium]